MLRRTAMSAAIWAAVALCLAVVPSAAEDDPRAGPHAFDDGITAARDAFEEGDCEKAVKDLMALLEAHKEQNYVKGRRAEIEDLMRRLVCGTKYDLPRARDVVSGKLQSWSAPSGKVKIVYTPETMQDWQARDGYLYLPARLVGPFTLEIKGKRHPADEQKPPEAVLGGDQHPETGKVQTWRAGFGIPSSDRKAKASPVPATLVHDDGGVAETIATKAKAPGKHGKAFKFVFKATKTKITAAVGSRRIGSADKPPSVYGYLSFRADGFSEAKLTAYVDPAWIEGQVEEILRGHLDKFDAEYDPAAYLPGWLAEPLTKERGRRRAKSVNPVDKLPETFSDDINEFYNEVRFEDYDKALARVDRMQAAGAAPAACEFLRAEAYLDSVQPEKALAHVSKAIELEPRYLEAIIVQGELLRQLGRFEEALASFLKMAEVHANSPAAYFKAAQAMMQAGRPEDANRITKLAARNGVTSEDLITLNGALRKLARGPDWRTRFQHRSQNYHVMSDMDHATCVESANLLEDAFRAYRERFAWVDSDTTRLFKVYIFKDREGFKAYMGNLPEFFGKPPDMAAGLYTPLLKQLLIWDHADRTEMLNTVRHEGWHQYMDRIMPDPPTWLNEGLAVYHENAVKQEGKLQFGRLHKNYVRRLRGSLEPLEKFFKLTPKKFYEVNTHRNYGQAWLLVHMLQHSTPEYLALFQGLIEDLKTDSAYNVMKKRFPPLLLPTIDKDLQTYLDGLGS